MVKFRSANIWKGTSYVTTTNVVSLTDTSTIDSTTTTTSTSTIPAPTNFTPITQDQDYRAKVKARSAKNILERGKEIIQCKKNPHGGHTFYPPMYPQSVTCNKLIEPVVIKRVTYTAKACTKTAPPKTKTVTTTVKKTHTDTIWPCEVTSTVTSSTSTVVTTGVDSTVTATVTSTSKTRDASFDTSLFIETNVMNQMLFWLRLPYRRCSLPAARTTLSAKQTAVMALAWKSGTLTPPRPSSMLRPPTIVAQPVSITNKLAEVLTTVAATIAS